jgi:virginiamycin B lyase
MGTTNPFARRLWALLAAIGLAALLGILIKLVQSGAPTGRFVEYAMPNAEEAPTAIAAAPDGTIWFTIDQAEAIGRWREGRIERIPTARRNFEPLGLAVAADGSAWYTDIAAGAIVRVTPSGEASPFPLDTPITRLGRLAVAPDGSVWFADATGWGITQLQNGVFKRGAGLAADEGPYGVAVGADGIVWASLQRSGKLLRIDPDGTTESLDVPRRGAVPTDLTVGADGSVWFLQFRGNRLGQFKDGKFYEFEIGAQNVGASGLAAAPNGTVWFGMVRTSSLGRLRDGRLTTIRLPRANARPYSVALDPSGNVWYADLSGYIGMLPARYADLP